MLVEYIYPNGTKSSVPFGPFALVVPYVLFVPLEGVWYVAPFSFTYSHLIIS